MPGEAVLGGCFLAGLKTRNGDDERGDKMHSLYASEYLQKSVKNSRRYKIHTQLRERKRGAV